MTLEKAPGSQPPRERLPFLSDLVTLYVPERPGY